MQGGGACGSPLAAQPVTDPVDVGPSWDADRQDRAIGEGRDGEDEQMAGAAPAFSTAIPMNVAALLFLAALTQSFSSGALTFFMNRDLNFGPTAVTQYWVYIGLMAWTQPLLGWASDRFIVLGERRRPLFVVCAVGSALVFAVFTLSTWVTDSFSHFVAVSMVNQVFTMGLYIPLNGMMVEVGKRVGDTDDESMARMSAVMSKAMTVRSLGSLLSSVLSLVLLLFLPIRALLPITAFMMVALAALMATADAGLFTPSDADAAASSSSVCERTREICGKVRRSFKHHGVRSDGASFIFVLAFVFFYTAMPDGGAVYGNYLYGAYTFPSWFFALLNLVGSLGATIGGYIYSLWMDARAEAEVQAAAAADANRRAGGESGGPQQQQEQEQAVQPVVVVAVAQPSAPRTSVFFIFVVGSVVWALAYLTNIMLCTGFVTDVLHIPVMWFVAIDSFFVSICVRFAFMPTITMAAEHAPKDFEATAFEVFSVCSIAGGTFSSTITTIIVAKMGITRDDYSLLPQLLVLSIACKLVPIPVAYFLPQREKSDHSGSSSGADEDAYAAATAVVVVSGTAALPSLLGEKQAAQLEIGGNAGVPYTAQGPGGVGGGGGMAAEDERAGDAVNGHERPLPL